MSLKEIDLTYNKNKILKEMETLDFHPFNDRGPDGKGETKIPETSWFYNPNTWLQAHVKYYELNKNSEIKNLYYQIKTLLGCQDIRARFYKQKSNTEVPMHSDNGTKCCVNIILSENYAPITFEESNDHFYKCAILDTQKRHSVKSHEEERILLKFSIFDIDYDTAVKNFNTIRKYLFEINLDYDKQKLINEGERIGYNSGYELLRRKRTAFKTMLEARIDNLKFLKKYNEINNVYLQIKDIFKKDIHNIIFYKLPIGSEIGKHTDPFTKENNVGFAVNILLTEDEETPLKFIIDDHHYDVFYNSVLFNANKVVHYVPTVKKERILIRYFVKNITYEEGVKICQNF